MNIKNKAIYDELENNLTEYFNTKVTINRKNDIKGKIEIEYYSDDELDRIKALIIK